MTNTLLMVQAVLGILEALVFIAVLAALLMSVRRLALMLAQLETRYVAPASERVNAILDDVHHVTTSARGDVRMLRRLGRRLLRWVIGRATAERGVGAEPRA